MENNKLIKYQPSFISRIKEFFKKLFLENIKEKNKEEEQKDEIIENNKRQKFLEQIEDKSNSASQVAKKVEILSGIENNENKLNEMTVEELIELSKYYDEIIEKNNNIIEKLKKSA